MFFHLRVSRAPVCGAGIVHKFMIEKQDWGWRQFITREQLLDEKEGWLVDDTVQLEAEITTTPKRSSTRSTRPRRRPRITRTTARRRRAWWVCSTRAPRAT